MSMSPLQARLQLIKKNIREFESKYHRPANSVQLLVVTKGQTVDSILAACETGQRDFGENYLQEALPKMAAIKKYYECEWHFIGKIQRNKTKKISQYFSWVHSVDHLTIAERLNADRPLALPSLNICVQVNVDHEQTKSGILPKDVLPFIRHCQSLSRLKVRGLMYFPPVIKDFSAQREACHQFYQLYAQLKLQGLMLDTLSMGMTHDMEAAIAEGATIVRIGRGVFLPHSLIN